MWINEIKAKVPCYQCPDREVGCHGTCERYKKYEKQRDYERKKSYARRQRERLGERCFK